VGKVSRGYKLAQLQLFVAKQTAGWYKYRRLEKWLFHTQISSARGDAKFAKSPRGELVCAAINSLPGSNYPTSNNSPSALDAN